MANQDDCRYQCQEEGAEMSNIPAFPAMHFDLAEREHGMSLRDYFAAKALQGLMHNYHPCELLHHASLTSLLKQSQVIAPVGLTTWRSW